jgi:hypothetical protein
LNQATKIIWLTASHAFELQASARLLTKTLAMQFLTSGALIVLRRIVLPLFLPTWTGACASFALALAGEILGRYVFFVGVVPKYLAASFISDRRAAA